MRTLVFVYIIEEVVHAHAQNAPFECFLSVSALSRVQALERDLLVVLSGDQHL